MELESVVDFRYEKGDAVRGYIYDPTKEMDLRWEINELAQLTNGALSSLMTSGAVAAVAALFYASF